MAKGVKKTLVLGFAAAVGFAAPITLYAAGSHYLEPVTAADVMPAYEILTRVRTLALEPVGEPVRRGAYYILHAYDRRGAEMRVVADAQFGDILSVKPVRGSLIGIANLGGARIIHVPAPGEESTSLDGDEDNASVAPADEPDAEQAAPAPRQRPAAAPQRAIRRQASKHEPDRRRPFSSAPPPLAAPRAVLSAPAAADDGPTPIRPTPRFTRDEPVDKFTAPQQVTPPPSAAASTATIPPAPAAESSSADAPPAQN